MNLLEVHYNNNYFSVSVEIVSKNQKLIDMSGNNFDKFLKLNASRGGRDKIYRVIQYAMKTNNALYEKPPPNLKRMESSLSSARHVFRLTTFIESIYGLGTAGKRIL